MADAQTIAVYDDKVGEYADVVSRTAPDRHLQAFIDALPVGGHALDLGCGPGNSAAMMRDAGLVPDAVDASQGMIDHAIATYDLPARVMTFDALTAEATYDGVWANFSLLHAPRADLPRHFAAIATALKPGGVFHIGMKTGTAEQRDTIGRQYTYVTVEELRDLFSGAGFIVLTEATGEGKGLEGTVAPWVVMLARKDPDA